MQLYRWMLAYLRHHPWLVVGFVCLDLLIALMNLAIPKFIEVFIDDVLPQKILESFFWILVLFAGSICLMVLSMGLQFLLQSSVTERVLREIQLSLFAQIRRLGFPYYEKHAVGETLNLFTTDLEAIIQIYRDALPELIKVGITAVLAGIMVLYIDVYLSLFLIPSIVLFHLFGSKFSKKTAEAVKDVRETQKEMNRKIYDSLSGLAVLRAYGKTEWDFARFKELFEHFKEASVREIVWIHSRIAMQTFLIYGGLFAVFIYGIYLVQNQNLTVGQFVAFIFYFDIVVKNTTRFITRFNEQKVLLFQAEKVYEVMELKPMVKAPNNPVSMKEIKGNIEFRNVQFSYSDNVKVLDGFDLKVDQGEKVALVGSSGSGKTTLLKMIGRLYDPAGGEVRIDGVPVQQIPLDQLRDSIGHVFQETYLFGTTIMDNIRFGDPKASDDDVYRASKAAHAHEFIMGLSEGYGTLVGERGIKLSGGQRQRIAIARMFLKNPKIILLDEATSALDNHSERMVQEALDRLLEGRTTIAVAHRLSTIRHYDKIVVVENGQNREMGNYTALMKQEGHYFRLEKGVAG